MAKFVVEKEIKPRFGWSTCSAAGITFWDKLEDAKELKKDLQFMDTQFYIRSKYRIKMITSR
jgi:hypothetical protein